MADDDGGVVILLNRKEVFACRKMVLLTLDALNHI